MKTTMRLNRIRIAPRKMRMVVDLVRGKKVAQAKDILRFRTNRGAQILLKFLEAAVASARSLGQGDELNLFIAKIAVNEGPKLKRWRARAKGSAYPIQKKVSSIILILDEAKVGKPVPQGSKREAEKVESTTPVHSLEARRPPKADKARLERAREAEQSASRAKVERGIQRFFRRKAM